MTLTCDLHIHAIKQHGQITFNNLQETQHTRSLSWSSQTNKHCVFIRHANYYNLSNSVRSLIWQKRLKKIIFLRCSNDMRFNNYFCYERSPTHITRPNWDRATPLQGPLGCRHGYHPLGAWLVEHNAIPSQLFTKQWLSTLLNKGHKCHDRDSNPHSAADNPRAWVQWTRPLGHNTHDATWQLCECSTRYHLLLRVWLLFVHKTQCP